MRDDDTTIDADNSQDELAPQSRLVLRSLFPQPGPPALEVQHGQTLGRSPDCTLRLPVADASRVHAKLMREGPVLALVDQGSTNGTFLDGEKVSHGVIRKGRIVRIGGWLGLFDDVVADGEEDECSTLSDGLWGGGELRRVLGPARLAATSGLSVVISGETGTGKEQVARAIHSWSGRRGPFRALNCGALSPQLAESELFGHKKGAFTGASHDQPGLFRSADGGTLLLDEVQDLPLSVQGKLLRVLQEGEVCPLGVTTPVRVDVRVVAAANRSLHDIVSAGGFRRDLLMRLAGVELQLPPLRERIGDIPALFCHFLRTASESQVAGVDAKLLEALCFYSWPGNVRELQLIARRVATLHPDAPVLKRRFLPDQVRSCIPEPREQPAASRAELDLQRLRRALRLHQSNLTRACADIGISRQRAYRLMGERSVQELVADASEVGQ